MPRLNMRGAKGLANCGIIRPARPASSNANQGRGQYKSMALQLPRWPQLPYTAREPQTRSTLERPPPHLAGNLVPYQRLQPVERHQQVSIEQALPLALPGQAKSRWDDNDV